MSAGRSPGPPFDARGALRWHIAHALEMLLARTKPSDAALHAMRKDLKRARAALRLLRDAVGKPAYAMENAALRDASRPLSAVRDARVALDRVRRLLREVKDAVLRRLLAGERRALQEELRTRRAALMSSQRLPEIAAELQRASMRVGRWRAPRDVWPVLRDGVGRIYRKGRNAAAIAATRRTDENLHEARKQVKYLGAAVEILFPTGARRASRYAKHADFVAARLGEDHDLALLQKRIAAATSESRTRLLRVLERRRNKLQRKALQRARRLYRRKPRAFIARLEHARGAVRATSASPR